VIYEKLKDKNFEIVSVAQDTNGVKDAGQWITVAKPTYTELIDEKHLVSKLYNMVNVPTGVWINEQGKIVRPNEVAFVNNQFKDFSGLDAGPYLNAEGSPVTSPKARYLQWRAVVTGQGAGPVLTSVTAAYLQRNLRPQVRSITVHPPGIVFQKPFTTGDPELAGFEDQSTPDRKLAAAASAQPGSSSPLGRRTYQKSLQTLIWKADDENDDDLVFDVLYRREGETTWKTLRKATPENILVWDTTTIPNGTYFVKIVASDSPSNPPATALTGELDSVAFEVDNSPPAIVVGAVRVERGRTIIPFDVKDDHSPIQRVEFSQDGQRWRGVFPVDGIADSREEHYELSVDGELGERGLTLRASDSMNNVATMHVPAPRRR